MQQQWVLCCETLQTLPFLIVLESQAFDPGLKSGSGRHFERGGDQTVILRKDHVGVMKMLRFQIQQNKIMARRGPGPQVPGSPREEGQGSTVPGSPREEGQGSTVPGSPREEGQGSTVPGSPREEGQGSTVPGSTQSTPPSMFACSCHQRLVGCYFAKIYSS